MSNLDVEGKDCQVGPMCYQEARDRIQLKMVNSFLPTQAPPSGGKAGAKAGRVSGGKQARVKQADPQTDRHTRTRTDMISSRQTGTDVGGGSMCQPLSPHVQRMRVGVCVPTFVGTGVQATKVYVFNSRVLHLVEARRKKPTFCVACGSSWFGGKNFGRALESVVTSFRCRRRCGSVRA